MKIIIIFFMMCGICFADVVIQSGRGELNIKNGDILQRNTFAAGQIKNLKDVTFINWAFNRKIPHTIVFVNCENLTFINCNLMNVELQADFKVQSCLTIHVNEYEIVGRKYREVECGDNKTRLYEMVETHVDEVAQEYGSLNVNTKNKIRKDIEKSGHQTQYIKVKQVLKTIKDTPDDKKIKAVRLLTD